MKIHYAWRKVVFVLLLSVANMAVAQTVALKTNLLSDITKTINLGVETALAPKWTADINAGFNPWTFSEGKRWRHWRVQPEVRYWFCEKFNKFFVGMHLIGGQYSLKGVDLPFGGNEELRTGRRYEGWAGGAGVVCGYQLPISRHWSAEAAIGAGYIYSDYDKYGRCGAALESDNANYWGITKAAVNLIYAF